MTRVAEASNGREAIQQFRTHRPDVTLMDLQMPGMNGIDAIIAIVPVTAWLTQGNKYADALAIHP
jgi:YesN/AraC family two-component response regulator